AQLSERQALISRLEDDLLASRTNQSGAASQHGLTGQTPGFMGFDEAGRPGQQQQQQPYQEDSSMIKVVCNQRDRFRARKMELEGEVSKLKADLAAAQAQVSSTTADNVALIERLRYVHGFKQRKNAQDLESGLDVEKRYSRMYDEGINPFAEFQGQQRERQKSSMPLPDRLMYRFGQLVFGSQSARLGTFIYLCGLHLLVLLLISRISHSSSSDMYAQQLHIMENSRHAMTAAMHHEPGSSMKSSHAPPPHN
ncbi:CASP C terminal-domain-containing protein, partial [Dunaliella salina]